MILSFAGAYYNHYPETISLSILLGEAKRTVIAGINN